MQSPARQFDSTPRRGGFTMIEMLVVLALILMLFGLSFSVLRASMDNARQEATRTTIRIVDSALQERIEDFNRVNLKSQAKQFLVSYNNGGNPSPNAQITEQLALAIVRKDRFRAAFPTRLEDLFGLDGVAGGGDDAPLWTVWKKRMAGANINTTDLNIRPAEHDSANENIELLWLALTEGPNFGSAGFNADSINPRHLRDTLVRDSDSDGILDQSNGIPELIDEWGQPLRFYNWSTQLFRPDGGTVNPATFGNVDINRTFFVQTASVLVPDAPIISAGTDPLPADRFSHMLNQDPDDPVGFLGAQQDPVTGTAFGRTGFSRAGFNNGEAIDEEFYHTIDTYWIPLIVSGGPDQRTGLFEPDGRDPRTPNVAATVAEYPRRLARPLAEDLNWNGSIDGTEDLNGDGVLETPDALYDNITNRQP